jgi:nitrogen-specific signal transduction histidine kinase
MQTIKDIKKGTTSSKKNPTLDKLRHDAKSNLAVINGYIQLLLMKTDETNKEYKWLQTMKDQCEKLLSTIDQMR